MRTRMGTKVGKITSIDKAGYCRCELIWEDGSTDTREIHLSDLRADTIGDRTLIEQLCTVCGQ